MADSKTVKKSKVPEWQLLVVGGVAIVILIAYMTFMGNKYMAPEPNHIADSMAGANIPSWLVADAKSCQGDYSKLLPAEQQKVMSYTKGTPHDASNEVALIWAGQH